MSRYTCKLGNLAYKTGFSFTKGESRLQNRNLIYKMGFLEYKRDSRPAIYHLDLAVRRNIRILVVDLCVRPIWGVSKTNYEDYGC